MVARLRWWHASARVVGLAGLLTAGTLVLLYEHRAHVLGLLPWALVLVCPLLHVFGHGRHGAGRDQAGHGASPAQDRVQDVPRHEDAPATEARGTR